MRQELQAAAQARCLPLARLEQRHHRQRRQFQIGQHRLQRATLQVFGHFPQRMQRHAGSIKGPGARHVGIVGGQARRQRQPLGQALAQHRAGFIQHHHVLVPGKIIHRLRAPAPLQIGWRGTQHARVAAQTAADQRRKRRRGKTDHQIVPALHRIGERGHAVEMHRHIGMGAGKALQQLAQAAAAKGQGRCHFQRARRAKGARANHGFGPFHVGQGLPGLAIEDFAFLGQRKVAAVAPDQRHAQARLQLGQAAADHRQRQAQAYCRLRQATRLGHADE